MRGDIEWIRKSKKIWVRADKSKNIYQVIPCEYEQILNNKIMESYKIDHSNTITKINRDTAKFTSKMQIVNRLGKIEEKSAYILFKDHKKHFLDTKQARLINPTKTELGLISKKLIQRITSRLLNDPKYNLWKDSMDTIEWFKNIKDKKRSTFVQFDIIEFYLSITRELLLKRLNHAREYTDIMDEEVEIILACRKSILVDNHRTWVKSHMDNFDIPMAAYNSTQVADLVGIYILDTLGRIVDLKKVGLYWDDGIIFIPDSNGPKTSNIQKKIIRPFKLLGLQIQIASNLKIVDFLDVTLNLDNGTFKPFSKNDSTQST